MLAPPLGSFRSHRRYAQRRAGTTYSRQGSCPYMFASLKLCTSQRRLFQPAVRSAYASAAVTSSASVAFIVRRRSSLRSGRFVFSMGHPCP